jgi:outer membrane murein-binding lipoprotein Lpp
MRAKVGLIAVAVMGMVVAGAVRGDEPPAKERELAKENARLKAEVEALRAEVKGLKEKLAERPQLQVVPYGELKGLPGGLRWAPPATTAPVPPGGVVPQGGAAPGMPPGTVRREFNGLPYYVIPMRGVEK